MKKKLIGLLILLFIYVISMLVGILSFYLMNDNINVILKIFIADSIATVVVWIFGIFLKTASIYDPYWSIQTPAIMLSLMFYYNNFSVGSILYFIVVMYWSIRLTGNFIITFDDIRYIDWRYVDIKKKTGKFYQIVNLLGINLMPTVLVFLASIPAFLYVVNYVEFSFIHIIGFVVMIIATTIELISDLNMHKFHKIRNSRSEIINLGLWKYSRHPNYLGEIMFWYGVLFVYWFSNFNEWYIIFGAIGINLLFVSISIPLAERKMAIYKDNFEEYKRSRRMLIPIPFKSKADYK